MDDCMQQGVGWVGVMMIRVISRKNKNTPLLPDIVWQSDAHRSARRLSGMVSVGKGRMGGDNCNKVKRRWVGGMSLREGREQVGGGEAERWAVVANCVPSGEGRGCSGRKGGRGGRGRGGGGVNLGWKAELPAPSSSSSPLNTTHDKRNVFFFSFQKGCESSLVETAGNRAGGGGRGGGGSVGNSYRTARRGGGWGGGDT